MLSWHLRKSGINLETILACHEYLVTKKDDMNFLLLKPDEIRLSELFRINETLYNKFLTSLSVICRETRRRIIILMTLKLYSNLPYKSLKNDSVQYDYQTSKSKNMKPFKDFFSSNLPCPRGGFYYYYYFFLRKLFWLM